MVDTRYETPREKYRNDPEYYALVRTLEGFIEKAHFTPSELREAAVLACINYEMAHIGRPIIDQRTEDAFRVLDEFTNRRNKYGILHKETPTEISGLDT